MSTDRECHIVTLDVGGTKVQASAQLQPGGEVTDVITFQAEDFPVANTTPGSEMGPNEGLAAVAAEYLRRTGLRPVNASVVIAGPVDQGSDKHVIPNGPWADIVIRKSHVWVALGVTGQRSWNVDMYGWGCSIGGLGPDDAVWVGGGNQPARTGKTGVAAVGTGLGLIVAKTVDLTQRRLDAAMGGASGLVLPNGKVLIPDLDEGEYGHSTAVPYTPYDRRVIDLLAERFGEHCSMERLVSGQGFANAYSAVCLLGVPHLKLPSKEPEELTPEEVTARACALEHERDPYCNTALEVVSHVFGAGVGNYILAHGIGRMVLAGHAWLLHRKWHRGLVPFFQACYSKGRFKGYVSDTQFLALKPHPSGLTFASVGAAVAQQWGF